MTSNNLSTKADVCDAALALLRQDFGYYGNSAAAAKCDNVWCVAWDALKNAHGWRNAMGSPSDTPPTDEMLRSLLVYAVARELAIPITGRQDDLKSVSAIFDRKVREAAIADITACAESQTDSFVREVMLDTLSNIMRSQESPVPHSTSSFVALVSSVSSDCEKEVRAHFGPWENETSTVASAVTNETLTFNRGEVSGETLSLVFTHGKRWKPCCKALVKARMATACGLDSNVQNLLMQDYQAKLSRALRDGLNDYLENVTDATTKEIIATVQANFQGNDALPINVSSFADRIDSVKATVRDVILSQHHWSFARKSIAFVSTRPSDCIRVLDVLDSSGTRLAWSVSGTVIDADSSAATLVYTARSEPSTWPAVVRSAYTAAVAAEIAQTSVSDPNAAAQIKAALDKLASARLATARVADLNEDRSGSEIVREVKNVLKAEFRIGDADLDDSATSLTERIEANLDAARLEILAAHNWNFARFTVQVAAYETPDGPFTFTRPTDALRISSVRTADDRLLGYTIDGSSTLCQEPPHSVTYVRDSLEVDEFPPLVRRALVYRLASDVAVSLPQRKGNPEYLQGLYREKLAAAATSDARESNPGKNAWGGSSYADAMRGRFPRTRARYPFHR